MVLFICISLLIILFTYVLYCNRRIRIKVITISDCKVDSNVDIVFISDLHIGKHMKKKELKRVINKVNKLNGDYLLVGGDMVGICPFKYYKDREISEIINGINIDKKFFVLGNHDSLECEFYNCFNVLSDEVIEITSNIRLLGLQWDECECLDYKLSRNNFNILLSHYPDRVSEYSKIDLALAGHSHGKQVDIPFLKFRNHKEKYVKGLYKLNKTKLYVTSGLGFSFLKIRFNSFREIVKICIRKC